MSTVRQHTIETPRVAHLVPALFDPSDGIIGGAERYAFELARHMAARTPTILVTFGSGPDRHERIGDLDVAVLAARYIRGQRTNPVSVALGAALRSADVIHCHQQHVLASSLAAAYARLTGRRVFVTELGGGGLDISTFLSTDRWFHGHLHISEYSRQIFGHVNDRRDRVILGGVDLTRFHPGTPAEGSGPVLFVGRILPHKGIHHLITAVGTDIPLRIIGRAADAVYLESLRRAAGPQVTFRHDCDDDALVTEYRSASCVVLPSVYRTPDGSMTAIPELLGQTVLEAMACARPVICTRVASLPEIVEDGVSGFVVAPEDPGALRAAIIRLRGDCGLSERFGSAGRALVVRKFQWNRVVDRCLSAYAA